MKRISTIPARRGFTLLEVLLGLALVGMVLAMGLSAGARALRAVERAQRLDEARELAQRLLSVPGGLPEVDRGRDDESSGLAWRMVRTRRLLEDELELEEVVLQITEPETGVVLCEMSLLHPQPKDGD